MAAKVFISCGQRPGREADVVKRLKVFFESKGYEAYVAIKVQTITDLNAGIIGALKLCDYYVLVNFAREVVDYADGPFRRGSLYSQQELGAAYALGFEKLLILNESGVRSEGMQQSIIVNTPSFSTDGELFERLEDAMNDAQWTPEYTRHLRLTRIWSPGSIPYNDHTTTSYPNGRLQKHFLGEIQNNRSDAGALPTIARLDGYVEYPKGIFTNSNDQSALKASYSNGYSHAVFPISSQHFDLFALHQDQPGKLFLNSALDFETRQPIIERPGDYILFYSVYATGFPALKFQVFVHLDQEIEETTAQIHEPTVEYSVPRIVPAY